MLLKIPKKERGKFRLIFAPGKRHKAELRALLPALNELQERLCAPCVHGFVRQRSPVTNALAHRGFKFTISFDLSDFFDTVKPAQVSHLIDADTMSKVFIDGHAYQGLPTSPIIANLAVIPLDRDINEAKGDAVYTRYADDLTLSCNDYETVERLRVEIPQLIARNGFTTNPRKTRVQCAKFGSRVITGVRVSDRISAGRLIKRRLRAARHKVNGKEIAGLCEWSKLKLPSATHAQLKSLLDTCLQFFRVNIRLKTLKQEPLGYLHHMDTIQKLTKKPMGAKTVRKLNELLPQRLLRSLFTAVTGK